MAKKDVPGQLRTLALTYPDTTEGSSCSNAAFKAGKKSFLFVGEKEESWTMMVKLSDSLKEAERLASEKPDNFSVGLHGWTTLRFPNGKGPAKKLLERWVDESFRLLATKKLIAQLDAS